MTVRITRKPVNGRYTFSLEAVEQLESRFWAVDYPHIMDLIDKARSADQKAVVLKYQNYRFTVHGRQVHKVECITALKEFPRCVACQDTGRVVVYNECGKCQGIGCGYCHEGLQRDWIPCQEPGCSVNRTGHKESDRHSKRRTKHGK